jgi:hypothetical protein
MAKLIGTTVAVLLAAGLELLAIDCVVTACTAPISTGVNLASLTASGVLLLAAGLMDTGARQLVRFVVSLGADS